MKASETSALQFDRANSSDFSYLTKRRADSNGSRDTVASTGFNFSNVKLRHEADALRCVNVKEQGSARKGFRFAKNMNRDPMKSG